MRPLSHNTTKIPRQLLEELGIAKEHSGSRDQRNGPGARKEQRKASRAQKKTRALHLEARTSKKESCAKSQSSIKRIIPSADLEKRPRNVHFISELAAEGSRNPKSTVKKPKPLLVSLRDSERDSPSSLAPPTPTLARGTKSPFLADDAEIAALEKALGVRGNKSLPKSFTKDGLDSLLDGLEDPQLEKIASKSKRDRIEGDEWLAKKRQKGTDGNLNPHLRGKTEFLGNENPSKNCLSDETLSNTDGDDETNSSNLSREQSRESPIRATRENPYKAPIAISDSQEPRKYLPPSLRNREMLGYEDLSHLRRQIQGLLNRLSESNIISILEDVENLYQSNSRQHVSTVLLDLLMGLLCDVTSLQDTFIILHAGFIAAIYKIIGTDFGAQVIQRIDEEFMIHYQSEAIGDTTSKQLTNLIGLLAELYNYQVIDNTLIIDFIRLFIDDFTESSAELIMKVMRNSSTQLRQDAASLLKDIVILIQSAVAKIGEENLSVRTKFMIETISNLKENRVKTGAIASTIATEHRLRLRKTLRFLNSRNIKASEPLRIGLADIRNADKRGKWWLVGASYRDQSRDSTKKNDSQQDTLKAKSLASKSNDLIQLAREQGMNTDVRRSIFVAVMSATDYQDAHIRLQKLRLKNAQELEIPKVLMHCCGAEENYNPFYSLVSRRICSDRKLKKAFKFSLWNLFKQMGEDQDNKEGNQSDHHEDVIGLRNFVNLAKMFGVLIAEKGLGIGVLEVLDFAILQPKAHIFVEVLLITIILHTQQGSGSMRNEAPLINIFLKSTNEINLTTGLHYFLTKVVSKTDIAGSRQDRDTVRWGCKAAGDALKDEASSWALYEDERDL